MNNKLNAKERLHLARVKMLPCSVCDKSGPSEAHHYKQGLQYTCIAFIIQIIDTSDWFLHSWFQSLLGPVLRRSATSSEENILLSAMPAMIDYPVAFIAHRQGFFMAVECFSVGRTSGTLYPVLSRAQRYVQQRFKVALHGAGHQRGIRSLVFAINLTNQGPPCVKASSLYSSHDERRI